MRDYHISGTCNIDPTCTIGFGSIIGKPFRRLITGESDVPGGAIIRSGVQLGCYSILGARAEIGERTIIDDNCIVEPDVKVGADSLLIYRAHICAEAVIGSGCVIGGFVAERVVVGNRARVFGKIVHSHWNPDLGWDEPDATEPSAIIGGSAFVGFGALIIGPISIGEGAYVCAGAIATKNVPPGFIAYDRNKFVTRDDWKGSLADSPFFRPRNGL